MENNSEVLRICRIYTMKQCLYIVMLNENIAIRQTSNDKLFTESQKEKTLLPGVAVSEIENIGWDKFIALTGIGGEAHVNH